MLWNKSYLHKSFFFYRIGKPATALSWIMLFLFPSMQKIQYTVFQWISSIQQQLLVKLIGFKIRFISRQSIIVIYCDLEKVGRLSKFHSTIFHFLACSSFPQSCDLEWKWFMKQKCSFNFLISVQIEGDLYFLLRK